MQPDTVRKESTVETGSERDEEIEIIDFTSKLSAEHNIVPSALLVSYEDPLDVLNTTRPSFSAYVDDRRCLRGVVAYHYHTEKICNYAIIDERPSKIRSKKPDTVLAVGQREVHRHADDEYSKLLIRYPDATSRRDAEIWTADGRDLRREMLTRFRPYRIYDYENARYCEDHPLSGSDHAPNWQHRNDPNVLSKEPGRGFYLNEQNDPGTVWQ